MSDFKDKLRNVLEGIFSSLPLSQHRKYVGSKTDQGSKDFWVIAYMGLSAWLVGSYNWSILAVISLGFLVHILNFLAWRAEPLQQKAMRNR